MANTAVLSVKIISDHKGAAKGFEETATKADKFRDGLGKANKAAMVAGGGMVYAGKKLLDMGEASSTADARIEKIVGNLGGFGKETDRVAGKVATMGEKLAGVTGMDPNVIKQGQATLLSFESLATTADQTGGAFDRAQNAAANLSAAGFGNMEQVSRQLGRSLEEPADGLSRLGRMGVTFTDSQEKAIKAMVESGDQAGAQEKILAAVEKRYDGVGASTADASDKMKVGWQLAGEELGQKLLPAFQTFTEYAIIAADWVMQNSDLVLTLAGAMAALAFGVIAVNAAVKTYTAITKAATAVQAAFNFIMAMNPITLVVIAIIALVAALVLAYKKVDWFRAAVDAAWSWIKSAAVNVWDFLSKTIPEKAGALKDGAVAKFNAAKDGIVNAVTSAKDFVVEGFTTIKDTAVEKITGLKNDIVDTITDIPDKFSEMAGDIISGLVDGLANGGHLVVDAVTGMVGGAIEAGKEKLGIASPSKVFKYLGDMTVKGFKGSVVKGRRAVAKAYDTMVAPPDAPRLALEVDGARVGSTRAAGTGARPSGITININGALVDRLGTARAVRDVLRDLDLAEGRA